MLSSHYLKFYNNLMIKPFTITEILTAYTTFISENFSTIHCGFAAILDGGSYKVVTTSLDDSLLTCSFPLHTHDIHQDVYDLDLVYTGSQDVYKGFPFISASHFNQLNNILIAKCGFTSKLVTLNIFYDHYLVCQLVFVATKNNTFSDEDILNLNFLRYNIEQLLYPLYSSEESDHTELLMDIAESIISSKHYLSSDNAGFLTRLLDLAFQTVDEPDYGSALLFENDHWSYVHTVGHDFETLSKIKIPNNVFDDSLSYWNSYKEVSPNIFLIDTILNINENKKPQPTLHIFDEIAKVSKPIKQTIQLHIYFNDSIKGIISLDKKLDSNEVFTRKTIDLLKKIHFLGQILFTYSTLNTNRQSFEDLTGLISKLVVSSNHNQHDFLHDFLLLLVNSLFEVDYASAYIRDKHGIHFLDAIGHDLAALQRINFEPHYFVNLNEIENASIPYQRQKDEESGPISTTLFSDLQGLAKDRMPKEIFTSYMNASKPIKDGLISQARLDEDVYMYISCDIKQGNQSTFSTESIHLFTVLCNLGFAFISNQYFIDNYKHLNSNLENKIKQRTTELVKTNAKLRALVNKDSLTNLYNHKAIIDLLQRELSKSDDLSIFLFDIDHFKEVNDGYGHQIGDEVLVNISHILLEDNSLISGRYGGEEFLLILPGLDLPEAITKCQSILSHIRSTSFIEDKTITVSGGVVTHKKGNAREMIQTADILLYQAKDSGRDQIKYNYR